MNDKEILALLEFIEDEGFNEISEYIEDTQVGVCPCCNKNIEEHRSNCKLVEAIEELKARTT